MNPKHTQFASKYPIGDTRKRAVEELKKTKQQSSSMLSNWTQPSNNVNQASFAVALEIAKRGKTFTDGEYVKDCFIRASDELFRDFKNKDEIMKKIKDLPLSAKTVQDRTAKKLAFRVLAIFGSTYSCEQAFSCMNTIKIKVRSQLTNKNLESCLKLKTTSYEPNLKELSKDMQSQCSH